MEDLVKIEPCFGGVFRGRRVLLTGHTGFKGSWLAEWLLALGAEVWGFSNNDRTNPSLFEALGLCGRLHHVEGDVRELASVRRVVRDCRPDFVFHLAAQAIVRQSYHEPVETYATNIMGTINVLEAVRLEGRPCSVVSVTTDKCYENKEWVHSYREEDAMGGYDPYSSSKGAAELAINAYRRSYFSAPSSPVRLASARAGNVIGGGDWAADRIIPDCVRALRQGRPIPVRNRISTRPWQHVLEPLSGYLTLAAALHEVVVTGAESSPGSVCGGFNFGPAIQSNRTVADLVQEVLKNWPGHWEDKSDPKALHESGRLNLATDKAFHFLRWQPVWNFEETVAAAMSWYRQTDADSSSAAKLTRTQIERYVNRASELGLGWASPSISAS